MRFPLDYGLYMFFGKKGSGKTCTLARLASEGRKQGFLVYSNVPLKGCFYFNASNFGKFEFPEHSLVLIDEVSLIWDNRDFKSFPKYTQNLFRYQRHYKVTVYMFSQTFDVDKKLRDLCDGLFFVKKKLTFLSLVRTVDKDFVVTQASDYGGSDIAFKLSLRPIILSGSARFIFLPKYWKHFNSFEKLPELATCDEFTSYVL